MFPQATESLLSKAKLSVEEMTQVIAARMAALPTVRSVSIAEVGEIAVDLMGGKRIEFQALPIARAMNGSADLRRQTLDDLVKRCA